MKHQLSDQERSYLYNKFMNKLKEVDIVDIVDIVDNESENIKKIKVMMKLFKDSGMEFNGELYLTSTLKIVYNLYNTNEKESEVVLLENIQESRSLLERIKIHDEIISILKKMNLWNLDQKAIQNLSGKIQKYKNKGIDVKEIFELEDEEKVIIELYNNITIKNVFRIIGNPSKKY